MSYAVTAGIIGVILKRGDRVMTRALWVAGALHLGMLASRYDKLNNSRGIIQNRKEQMN